MYSQFWTELSSIFLAGAGIGILLYGIYLFKNPQKYHYQKPDTPEKKIKEFSFVIMFIGLVLFISGLSIYLLSTEVSLVILLLSLSSIFLRLGFFFIFNPKIITIKMRRFPPTAPGKRGGLFLLGCGVLLLIFDIILIYFIFLFS